MINLKEDIMEENKVYIELTEKLGVKTPSLLTKILEEAYSPEECTLLMELFEPATCQELAARLSMDESKVQSMLDALVANGALTHGKTQYAFHKSVLAFHHDVYGDTAVMPIPEKIRALWNDFFYNEWADSHFFKHYLHSMEETGLPFFRVWPALGALELSPNIKPEDIIPEENWRMRIDNSNSRIVAPCGCRVSWGNPCEHPVDGACFSNMDSTRGRYYLDKPGRALKVLEHEEALDHVRSLEKAGLVHIGSCYCCPDSCEIMFTLHRAKRWDLLGSSRFVPEINEEACTGCQVCVKKCYFDAIEMKEQEDTKKKKATLIKEKCLGCGLCIVACKAKAMVYVLDKPPEHITTGVNRNAGTDAIRWGEYELD